MASSWRRFALLLALPSVLAATACTVADEPSEATEDELNYRSTAGQEYELSTTVTFATPAEAAALTGAEKEKAITARAEALRTQVLSTISSEFERLYPEEARIRNGAVAIQYRQLTPAFRDLVPSGDKYSMTVAGEFGAMKDVESKLPMTTGADGTKYLPVTTDLGEGEIELQVSVKPIERSLDAYPKYLELLEDGLDVGFFAGGDHHEPAQDINHARSVYDDLVRSGFASPVATFEALKIDSGPLTSTIKVKGEDVDVRVRIYHVNMTPENDRSALVDAYKHSMRGDDVIIYDGHAGKRLDYSGVVLAYKPTRVSVTAAQFAEIETKDKQQIYLFNGCETYTGYADKLYQNPNRRPDNTDVITTVNYSAIQRQANQVIAFIHQLIDQKNGAWVPRSWDSVLSKMNAVGERSWFHGYGVHGIDENAKVSPIADVSKVGQTCTTDAQCGSADAKCVQKSSTQKVCGVACADSSGCPNGTKCVLPRGLTALDDRQCLAQ
jgi:hypothetical protein